MDTPLLWPIRLVSLADFRREYEQWPDDDLGVVEDLRAQQSRDRVEAYLQQLGLKPKWP
jgi:hypothetical protein